MRNKQEGGAGERKQEKETGERSTRKKQEKEALEAEKALLQQEERLREPFQRGKHLMLTEKANPPLLPKKGGESKKDEEARVKQLADKIAACKQNALVFKRVSGKALSEGYKFEPNAFYINEYNHRVARPRGFDKGWWENNPEKAGKWVQGQFTPVEAVHVHVPKAIDSRTHTKSMANYKREDYRGCPTIRRPNYKNLRCFGQKS